MRFTARPEPRLMARCKTDSCIVNNQTSIIDECPRLSRYHTTRDEEQPVARVVNGNDVRAKFIFARIFIKKKSASARRLLCVSHGITVYRSAIASDRGLPLRPSPSRGETRPVMGDLLEISRDTAGRRRPPPSLPPPIPSPRRSPLHSSAPTPEYSGSDTQRVSQRK